METTIVCWGNIEIGENKMETTNPSSARCLDQWSDGPQFVSIIVGCLTLSTIHSVSRMAMPGNAWQKAE